MRQELPKASMCLLFVLLLITGCGEKKENDIDKKRELAINNLVQEDSITKTVEEVMELHGLKGLSVAVVEDYEIIWLDTWGVKEANTFDSLDTETAFSTASISKGVTATLLALLEDKGLIDLSAPVSKYLKRWQLPENEFTKDSPITLEHM